jgi:hypothetical protein
MLVFLISHVVSGINPHILKTTSSHTKISCPFEVGDKLFYFIIKQGKGIQFDGL